MYMLNPDVAGDGESGGELRNLFFQIGQMEGGVEFEFEVDCVKVIVGDSGKVIGIKLIGVEQEVVAEMGLDT